MQPGRTNFVFKFRHLFAALVVLALSFGLSLSHGSAQETSKTSKERKVAAEVAKLEQTQEVDIPSQGIFSRAWQGGFIVFSVLFLLIVLSILSWGLGIAKVVYLTKIDKTCSGFVKVFWDSRSLNDLNGKLNDYPYSPVKEVFRTGYAELVRGSQLRDSSGTQSAVVINAAIDNLTRSLQKAKYFEKRRMERYLWVLAISASASPFIGLFGTVWGIMGAFEGIARSGSASLAAVAPGISEALIATAFGLAAAIPAVIAYNIAGTRIRGLLTHIDGFSADFLNIVERYLVTDKTSKATASGSSNVSVND